MVDVVVVGSYNHDHVWRAAQFPVPGETRLGTFGSGPGGKGFNQAVAAVRQGARTAFVGALGEDAIGDGALALGTREGLEMRVERRSDAATGTAAILLDGSGQNMIVVGPGANAELSAEHVEAQASLIGTARRPNFARSWRRSGARPPMPPIWIAIELKLAKPHRA